MHVSAQMVQQLVCEWLLTSAVIQVMECGCHQSQVCHLDILQNLVANTRKKQSATSSVPWSRDHCGGLLPADFKTCACKGSVSQLTQAGPSGHSTG